MAPILVDILLVRVCVVSIAAVRIRRVAVRLDDTGIGRGALESLRTSGKLLHIETNRVSGNAITSMLGVRSKRTGMKGVV